MLSSPLILLASVLFTLASPALGAPVGAAPVARAPTTLEGLERKAEATTFGKRDPDNTGLMFASNAVLKRAHEPRDVENLADAIEKAAKIHFDGKRDPEDKVHVPFPLAALARPPFDPVAVVERAPQPLDFKELEAEIQQEAEEIAAKFGGKRRMSVEELD